MEASERITRADRLLVERTPCACPACRQPRRRVGRNFVRGIYRELEGIGCRAKVTARGYQGVGGE